MTYTSVDLADTIVALATPTGVGAIGVVRLSGEKSIHLVNEVFTGKNLLQQKSHTLHYGSIKNSNGTIIDDVLVSLFIAPKSYTKENVVEISCHGSSYIIQQLLELFIAKGARLAQPGEFTQRAFLNGQFDLSQAEAVADLIASHSAKSHEIAMRQMRGGISNEIQKLRQELIDFASLIELELDFGEEDVEFANREDLKQSVHKINRFIQSLIRSFQLGNAIKNGVTTVLAGRPNAGKSTLLNALLNEERAIVSPIAGTTRDTIEETLNINGILFRLIDTAGIRAAQDQIEALGVERTLQKIQQSAIVVYVFDVIETPPEEVAKDIQQLFTDHTNLLLVANKMDLNPYTKWEHYAEALTRVNCNIAEHQFIPVSAIHQMNMEYLKECLSNNVLQEQLETDVIISNLRHVEALQKAHSSLEAVLTSMAQGITSDFIAMDIRQALFHLGSITGAISSDDLLSNIFSRFCIGK